MKILYHHRTLADGAEGVHIHSMVDAFKKLGHDVRVESLARPAGKGRGDEGMLSVVRQRMPQAVFEIAALGANVVEFANARRRLRALAPQLVYKRHALFDMGVVTAATRVGVPVVLEVNALYSAPVLEQFEPLTFPQLAARIERRVFRLSTVVAAVSTPLAEQIRRLAGPDARVLVLPNGADPELFDPDRADGRAIRDRYGLTNGFVVGWVGVLRRWHGLEVLLGAVSTIPDASLLIVGDGPERPAIERHIASLGMSRAVRVTGRIDHHDVPACIAAFDVAVSADDRTRFASPMKVVEYMSMARAVVVPRLPNFLDLVRDGATGMTFEAGDENDLRRRLTELQASPELRKRLGDAARQEVVHRLNWKENARSVVAAVGSTRMHERNAS